jgi:hypothetical protein
MIAFITGSFGVGRTTAAHEVVRLRPVTVLFDPEEIGAFLRRLLGPLPAGDDDQDFPLWRALTVDLAARVHADFGCDLMIPMAIWRRDYRDCHLEVGVAVTSHVRVDTRCWRVGDGAWRYRRTT